MLTSWRPQIPKLGRPEPENGWKSFSYSPTSQICFYGVTRTQSSGDTAATRAICPVFPACDMTLVECNNSKSLTTSTKMAEVGQVGQSLELGELGDFGWIWGDFTHCDHLRPTSTHFAKLRHIGQRSVKAGQSRSKLVKDFELLHSTRVIWSTKLPGAELLPVMVAT